MPKSPLGPENVSEYDRGNQDLSVYRKELNLLYTVTSDVRPSLFKSTGRSTGCCVLASGGREVSPGDGILSGASIGRGGSGSFFAILGGTSTAIRVHVQVYLT